ncbi:MAG TPA: ABC transporter permease [Pyrinomonadaceae bacterium]|nr:ABC transporter permease [Pyrinomonadaceae bacterium]
MGNILQDLRYGVRMLLRNPGFTIVAVLALALGIGANSAIFSVINTVLLRPLPYPNPEQLTIVWERNNQQGVNRSPASLLNFVDWRAQNQSFEHMAALRITGFNLTSEGEPERVQAASAAASIFPLLGAEPMLGRTFLPEEEKAGRGRVTVLSHGLWQRRFGGDAGIVGKDILLNSEKYTVVGVLPASFQFEQVSLWVPLTTEASPEELAAARGRRMYLVLGRLRPGVGTAGAQNELNALAGRLAAEHPAANAGWGVGVVPLREHVVGMIRPALLILFTVVGLVLLIACANMANLLLARAATREKEIAIRMAMGATRPRLIRQLLTESVLLAFMGGALGLLLTVWAKSFLVAVLPPNNPLRDQVGIDLPVLAFTVAVAVLTGLLFGLAPALQASRPDLNEVLKEGGKTSAMGFRRRPLRSLLVVAEVTLALVLLIGAGLMLRSFLHLQEADPGLDVRNAIAMQVSLPPAKYSDAAQQIAFFHHILERLAALPNVEAVAADSNIPLGTRRNSIAFQIEGRPPASSDQMLRAEAHEVTPNYFRAMGIRQLLGRDFTTSDVVGAQPVVIVNEALARRYFPNEDPIGKRVSTSQPGEPDAVWFNVVGVVGDVRHAGLAAEPGPQMYWAYYQDPVPNMSIVVRTKSDPAGIAALVREEIRKADGDIPSFSIRTLEQMAADSLMPSRVTMLLLGFFAAVALVLAAAGIYGIMSYSVSQRRHEIGVRLALGARPRDIIMLILRQGLILTLVGTFLGLLAAFAATRVMSSLLYGVSATDLLTFAGAPLALIAVAVLACLVPARRATKVDPMVALRYE